MKLPFFSLISLSVLLNVAAQLGLKLGVTKIRLLDCNWTNFLPMGLQLISNPVFLIAIFFYMCSLIIWLFVLARVDVSMAYPLVSLGYVINALAAYYLLDENLTFLRLGGIFVILIGVFMVARG